MVTKYEIDGVISLLYSSPFVKVLMQFVTLSNWEIIHNHKEIICKWFDP